MSRTLDSARCAGLLAAGFAALWLLPAGAAPPAPSPAPPKDAAAAPARIVEAIDGPTLKKVIEAQKGKVVLLNLWATWCLPCVGELPAISKLYADYKGKGLAVVSASMDDPEDRHKVLTVLTLHHVELPVYMRRSGSVDAFFDPIDRKWTGAVPMTYLFDRKGKRIATIARDLTYEEWVARVKPLLK